MVGDLCVRHEQLLSSLSSVVGAEVGEALGDLSKGAVAGLAMDLRKSV